MLLTDRMKEYPFSPNEKVVIDFILEKKTLIKDYSVKAIAAETFTSPSILVQIAQKLDCAGWVEFKENFLTEINYLKKYFQSIDANLPFYVKDPMMTIIEKMGQLHVESIQDTLSLISHDDLHQAVRIMERSKKIRIFAVDHLNYAGEEFVFKLGRIDKEAEITLISDNQFHAAAMASPDDCAICISYSGDTPTLLKTVTLLQENQVPIIAITSIGNNRLAELADVVLNTTTREKSYSKIADFSSLASINFILDTLYACYFSLNYQQNLDHKVRIAEIIETNYEIENAASKKD
ncbi:MurR/RpiR family transcriptional regulator [Enterococcus sp. AZ072]|uniref:MurR/RpiR family transcriptional regulator n=1 Tax=unclassified Enterococcus TaxID=2608891 RepID=UPI003D28421A